MADQSTVEGRYTKKIRFWFYDLPYVMIGHVSTPYLSVLLDHLIWPWTKEEIEVQYPTNGPIGDGRVGL